MLYRRYGEIIISEYILRECDASAPFDKFIKGLTEDDIYGEENKLDMFYLSYEKRHNSLSFIYT